MQKFLKNRRFGFSGQRRQHASSENITGIGSRFFDSFMTSSLIPSRLNAWRGCFRPSSGYLSSQDLSPGTLMDADCGPDHRRFPTASQG
jgi:hypothetical protein